VINTNLPPILHRFRYIAFDRPKIAIFGYPSCSSLPTEGFPWDVLRKILRRCQWMAKVPKRAEKLPRISTGWVGCTSVTDRRQRDRRTDGRQHIANVGVSSRSLKVAEGNMKQIEYRWNKFYLTTFAHVKSTHDVMTICERNKACTGCYHISDANRNRNYDRETARHPMTTGNVVTRPFMMTAYILELSSLLQHARKIAFEKVCYTGNDVECHSR